MSNATNKSSGNLGVSATTLATGKAILAGVNLTAAAADVVITIYDNTAASGKVIFQYTLDIDQAGIAAYIDIPELNISEDCISRYLRGATKTTTKDYHIDLVDYLTNVFQQIVYEVDRSKSLDKNDRKALMRCLENKRKLMNKAKISTSLSFLNQKPNHLFFYSFYWCALIVKKSERCGGNYS